MLNFRNKPRKLSKLELQEIQELNRIAQAEAFKAHTFEQNTALLNIKGIMGKAVAELTRAQATLLERVKNEYVNAKLAQLGYPKDAKVSLDLQTGKITQL